MTTLLKVSKKNSVQMKLKKLKNSFQKPIVAMEDDVYSATMELREFMNVKVYRNALAEAQEKKAFNMISALYNFIKSSPEVMPDGYKKLLEFSSLDQVVCDYISGMTDMYSICVFKKYFTPDNFIL